MLQTSLNKNSDSVFLDILTYQDLQVLKSRKQGGASQSQSMGSTGNNKRYLILTYVVEFDKVHYPLPLNFNEAPDIEALKGTIKRLRFEMEEMGKMTKAGGSTGNSFFSVQEKDSKDSLLNNFRLENEFLKSKVKKLEEEGYQKKGAVEYDLIIKTKLELEQELEALKATHIKELSRLSFTIEELQRELLSKKSELHKIQKDFMNGIEHSDGNKRMTDHIMKLNEESESELFSAKKALSKQERELEKALLDLDLYKQNDKKQKIRIRQLELDLESALKKTSIKGITDRLHSGGSRANSPALSSKRSVSVPHRSFEKKPFDRKNSSNLSNLSNKGKYSRDNSINSDSAGYLSRWNRKNSPDVIKKKVVTPQRKITGSSSLKTKPYYGVNNNNKNSIKSNAINKNSNKKTAANYNNYNGYQSSNNKDKSGKKSYEKPWALSKNKNQSPLPKLSAGIKPTNRKTHESSDDENALFKKLEDLRNKNKGEVKGKVVSMTSIVPAKSYNKENSGENIDERLNKLQNLLKMAKN